jgi:general secretion pathway protein C
MLKRILGILNIVLLTVSIFFGVKIFYGVTTARFNEEIISAELNRNAAAAKNPRAGISHVSTERRFSDYRPIVERDLFKTKAAVTKAAIVETNIQDLEKTRMQLKLWGTITGDAGGTAYAVIEDTSKRRQPQSLYREGDSIGNASIALILREKVVLRVDGKDEILAMEQIMDQPGRTASPLEDPAVASASLSPPIYQESDFDREVAITRDTIENALSDVGNLMRQVRIRPYFEDGNPEGVLLSGVRRDSIFEQMGLKSGDVIKGVNGEPIRSVDDAMKLYQGLTSAQNVQLQIERDSVPQTISYRIQ